MSTYKTNIRLLGAGVEDYDLLDKAMESERFDKLHYTDISAKQLMENGREYHYKGANSLPEITAAAYRAAHNSGKDYRFTIINQRGATHHS